jgi:SsrA-binding protein
MIAQNKKARHDYTIEDVFEAGLVLQGTEVKALREGRASLTDSYASVRGGEAWLLGAHIAEYTQGTWNNHAPRRARKLLLHKHEIEELERETKDGGNTLVPLALYFSGSRVKIEIALAKGKKNYDKRAAMAERDSKRELDRVMGRARKGRPV